MKAMVIVQGDQGGRLELRGVPEPEPGPEEILMRVEAAAVNRGDIYMVTGSYFPPGYRAASPPIQIPGQEAAGVVLKMGRDASGFAVGDRVMGFCKGAYAELTTVDHRLAMPVPGRLTPQEAATVPVAFMTEYNALVMCARLQPGESVLVHGAAAGVGVAAIQVAKLFGARPVMGTDRGDKLDTLKPLGLDVGIDYRSEDFADVVLARTDGRGVDVVIDHIGAPYLESNLRCMAVGGRLVSVGRIAGAVAPLDMDILALKRIELIGVTFRTRSIDEKRAIADGVMRDLLPALAEGRLRPVVDRVFPLSAAVEAQAYMLTEAQIGRIVLTV